jgi:plastocyanin
MMHRVLATAAVCLIGIVAAVSATADEPQIAQVTMTNFAFTPKSLHLKRDVRYRLHFVNSGSSAHNFDAPEFFAAVTVMPQDQAKVSDGKVEVDESEAVDVTVTPRKAGTYPVKCSHFLHTMFGMTGEAVIE